MAGVDITEEQADGGVDKRYLVPGLSRGLALLQLFTRLNP